MKIYFVRHGESVANVEKIFSNRGLKHPLTNLGRKQAYGVAVQLEVLGIGAIYSSPILRAIETAVVIAHKLRLPYTVQSNLREVDAGQLEDKSTVHEGAEYWQLMERWHQGEHHLRIVEGESKAEVMARAAAFLEGLEGTPGPAVAITHGGFLVHGIAPLCNLRLSQSQIEGLHNTAIVEIEHVGQSWRCNRWGGETLE